MEATNTQEPKAMKDAEWLAAKIAHIHGLKNSTQQQKLFSMLAQLTKRTEIQQRQLAAFIKAEKLEDRAAAARAQTNKLISSASRVESVKARKERTRRLIELGGLVVKAGMDGWATTEIMGMLAAGAHSANDERRAVWATRGAEVFAESKKVTPT